jgi:hypothetical protein
LGATSATYIARLDAAAARHVDGQDCGIAGNVRPDVPAQEARVEIIGAAHAGPNDELDLFSFVEIGDRIGAGRLAGKGQNQRSRHRASQHGRVPIEPTRSAPSR